MGEMGERGKKKEKRWGDGRKEKNINEKTKRKEKTF
ncbi:hypothetical protein MsAc7_04130 [Methanolapillus millepedarum]|uniref:Uncharacterized protein n=1 Tax=Methanolapillus millepedarum TaxID=3028296 RepID=A0AA96V1X4_9EURY|nr:hypothetical protein MsAc7_04130 [Methanosarcinaceae archaeon Ac7]